MKHLILSLIVVFFASGWFGKSQKENSNAEETIERLMSQLLEFKHQKQNTVIRTFFVGKPTISIFIIQKVIQNETH